MKQPEGLDLLGYTVIFYFCYEKEKKVLIDMGGSGKESRGFTGKTQGSVRKVFNSFVRRVFFQTR